MIQSIILKAAATPVPYTPYKLSASTPEDVPTATICGDAEVSEIFLGSAETLYNVTPGKNQNDPIEAGDLFSAVLDIDIATVRPAAAISGGVSVAAQASGEVAAAGTGDPIQLGVTLGAGVETVGILVLNRANPTYINPAYTPA